MGLVFDPERVGSGNIPTYSDGQTQADAALVLGESLAEITGQQPWRQQELQAYMLYGSTRWYRIGDANRRSDVDILGVINPSGENSGISNEIEQRVLAVERTFNVDVGKIIFTQPELEGSAKVNPFYSEYLCNVRGLRIGNTGQFYSRDFEQNPAMQRAIFGILPFNEAWPFAIEYLKARRGQFQTILDQTDPDLSALKGPFELPRNLGRTLKDFFTKYLSDHTGVYNAELTLNPEDEVIADAVTQFKRPEHEVLLEIAQATGVIGLIGDDIERLHHLDSSYTDLLEAVVAGDVAVGDYEKWLRSVYTESFERAFKVAQLSDAIVHGTVELAHLDPNYGKLEVLMYEGHVSNQQEFHEVVQMAGQIVPVTYDIERLLFQIAPKYPEMARRYEKYEIDAAENARLDAEFNREIDAEMERLYSPRFSGTRRYPEK